MGLPACVDLGLSLFPKRGHHHLNYTKQKVKQRVPYSTKSTSNSIVAAVTEDSSESTSTEHPTEADWEPRLEKVPEKYRKKLLNLLMKYRKQFWKSGFLPPIKNCTYGIKYEGGPFREPMIPLNKEDVAYVNDLFDEQIEEGLCGKITTDTHRLQYVSNMFLKYEADKKRPCINYRKLNLYTLKTGMPIPSKERLIAMFAGADFYICLDCKAAYNQLLVETASQKYLVFVFPDRNGKRRYVYPTRANFGTSNMPGEYQRISTDLFESPNVGVYLDDITIKGMNGNEDQALEELERVLETAKEHNVTFSFKKAEMFTPEHKFLGEILSKEGRKPNPDRIKSLKSFPLPKTRKQLRGFLGLYNFLAP